MPIPHSIARNWSRTALMAPYDNREPVNATEVEMQVLEWMRQAGFIDSYAYDIDQGVYIIRKAV